MVALLTAVGCATCSIAILLSVNLDDGRLETMFLFAFLMLLWLGLVDGIRAIRRSRNPIEDRHPREDSGFGFSELYPAALAIAGIPAAFVAAHRYGLLTLLVPLGAFLGLAVARRMTRSLGSQRVQTALDAAAWITVAGLGVMLAAGIPNPRDERLGGLVLGGLAGAAIVVALKTCGKALRARLKTAQNASA
jgi:hypothetical protein